MNKHTLVIGTQRYVAFNPLGLTRPSDPKGSNGVFRGFDGRAAMGDNMGNLDHGSDLLYIGWQMCFRTG